MGASSGPNFLMRIGGMSSGPAAESDFNFVMAFFIVWGLKIILIMTLVWGVKEGGLSPLSSKVELVANKEASDSVFLVEVVAPEPFGWKRDGNEGQAKFLFIVLYKE